jgi:hypothetical protein
MPRRGIKGIFCGDVVTDLKKSSNPVVPTLTKTVEFDKGEKGKKSKRWERLESGESIEKLLNEFGSSIEKQKIEGIKINGRMASLTDLYSFEGNIFCIFGVEKNEWSDEKNVRSLFVVGAKTPKELEFAGYTKRKESYLPLLLCDNKGSITMLNSL